MNPHVACRFGELEKHLRELCLAATGAIRLRGDAIAETVLMICSWNVEDVYAEGADWGWLLCAAGVVGMNSAVAGETLSRGRQCKPLPNAAGGNPTPGRSGP